MPLDSAYLSFTHVSTHDCVSFVVFVSSSNRLEFYAMKIGLSPERLKTSSSANKD